MTSQMLHRSEKTDIHHVTPVGSKTFAPHLASVILSRRKSIDGADMMKNKHAPSSPVANASQLLAPTPRLVRARSLPCLASWDVYGEESIVVEFDVRRSSISSYTNLADHLRMLGVYDSPISKSSRGNHGSVAERIRQDDVIYEVHKDKNYIVYATKEKLLKSLVDPRTDMEYISQYLTTHLWHTTPVELLDRLIAIFNPGMQSNELFTTRMRVLCIVQQWTASFPKDLAPHKEKVDHFMEVMVPQAGFSKPKTDAPAVSVLQQEVPKPTIPKKLSEGMKHQFLDFHPTEVARQLTLIEHQRFRDLPRHEFVRQAWNKKDNTTKAPLVVSAIKKFNEISYWVAAEIVFCANSKQRVTVVKRMIQIANKCLSFNNFNTVMEIIAGLHMSSIQRLKKTWKALSSKYTAIFEEITKFISTEGNYRNYRNALSKVELPANPYLGVFLRDLTFIEDGNPDFVEDDQFLNFEKMRMLNSVLSSIAKYQSVPYNFEPVPCIQEYIISATTVNLSDASLHKYSLLCEASSVGNGSSTLTGSKSKRLSLKSP
eukprot:Phypoly_transcript_04401.p1 GENE.Phypoly_transcript_04401~~Phypoly_transcript_04401.p1  ORF type:complete len:543 (+),score=73.34 Phypoly_transcript_04401:306-1934(+)